MKVITIQMIGLSQCGVKIRVEDKEHELDGDELLAMVRHKLACAAPHVVVLMSAAPVVPEPERVDFGRAN
jgi:hypothetical protein